ncbi:MAG: type II secretion system GspH family protein, partial [Candidatus Pacebacteria bacterium]|nr:type II secretion system GspH family protein [Candidatus Paceibacterota bacterium]
MQKEKTKKLNGFTLIEILVVIGLIALLAAIVIIAVNPARQFAQGRNTQRTGNVNTILNAIGQNIADNKGTFVCASGAIPIATSAVPNPITCGGATPNWNTFGAAEINATSTADLGCVTPTYVPALPFDPGVAGAGWTSEVNYNTGYYAVMAQKY